MNAQDTKYTRIEYERRFLVHATAAWRGAVRPGSKRIDDKYLHDTRLRLRVVTDTASNDRTLKLTKKADSTSAYFRTISRILLSNDELRVFDALPGDRLTKTRHHASHLDRVFASGCLRRASRRADPVRSRGVVARRSDERAAACIRAPRSNGRPVLQRRESLRVSRATICSRNSHRLDHGDDATTAGTRMADLNFYANVAEIVGTLTIIGGGMFRCGAIARVSRPAPRRGCGRTDAIVLQPGIQPCGDAHQKSAGRHIRGGFARARPGA